MDSVGSREFGRRIRTQREARQLSIDAVAMSAAVPGKLVEQLERGDLAEASLESLHAVARVLDVPLLQLLANPNPKRTLDELRAQKERETAAFFSSLPAPLRTVVEEERAAGRSIPEDALKVLAGIEFQQPRPTTPDAWRAMLRAIMQGLYPASVQTLGQ